MTSLIPFRGLADRPFLIENDDRTQGEALPTAEFRQVSPDYFNVMGIPVSLGRTFTDGDDTMAPPVVVVELPHAGPHQGGQPHRARDAHHAVPVFVSA